MGAHQAEMDSGKIGKVSFFLLSFGGMGILDGRLGDRRGKLWREIGGSRGTEQTYARAYGVHLAVKSHLSRLKIFG